MVDNQEEDRIEGLIDFANAVFSVPCSILCMNALYVLNQIVENRKQYSHVMMFGCVKCMRAHTRTHIVISHLSVNYI